MYRTFFGFGARNGLSIFSFHVFSSFSFVFCFVSPNVCNVHLCSPLVCNKKKSVSNYYWRRTGEITLWLYRTVCGIIKWTIFKEHLRLTLNRIYKTVRIRGAGACRSYFISSSFKCPMYPVCCPCLSLVLSSLRWTLVLNKEMSH